MGFSFQGVWVMGYCGLMGYGLQIPANQPGGPNFLWVIRGYGFSQAWVMRVSTVYIYIYSYLRFESAMMPTPVRTQWGNPSLRSAIEVPIRQYLSLREQKEFCAMFTRLLCCYNWWKQPEMYLLIHRVY